MGMHSLAEMGPVAPCRLLMQSYMRARCFWLPLSSTASCVYKEEDILTSSEVWIAVCCIGEHLGTAHSSELYIHTMGSIVGLQPQASPQAKKVVYYEAVMSSAVKFSAPVNLCLNYIYLLGHLSGLHARVLMEARGCPAAVVALLPPCRPQGLNSGHQTCMQVPLPASHLSDPALKPHRTNGRYVVVVGRSLTMC